MKKLILACLVAFAFAGGQAQELYVFSADGVAAGSKPRELPSQGFNRATGEVVVGLHARPDEVKAACGWWRYVPAAAPVARSNEVWRVSGYTFANCTATPQYSCTWRKVRPTKYSKLSIYLKLSELGKWEAAEAWMKGQGLYTAFDLANEISSDHPMFAAAKAQVAAALGMTDEEIEAALKECVTK